MPLHALPAPIANRCVAEKGIVDAFAEVAMAFSDIAGSRMESGGAPGMIQVTHPVYETLKDKFAFEPHGAIEVKGKASVEAWQLKL